MPIHTTLDQITLRKKHTLATVSHTPAASDTPTQQTDLTLTRAEHKALLTLKDALGEENAPLLHVTFAKGHLRKCVIDAKSGEELIEQLRQNRYPMNLHVVDDASGKRSPGFNSVHNMPRFAQAIANALAPQEALDAAPLRGITPREKPQKRAPLEPDGTQIGIG